MRMVRVPALSAAKFRLCSEVRAAGVRNVDLARRMKVSPSQVDRLLDITHRSKLQLDQLEAAFAVMARDLRLKSWTRPELRPVAEHRIEFNNFSQICM
jgi:antitoxin HicB